MGLWGEGSGRKDLIGHFLETSDPAVIPDGLKQEPEPGPGAAQPVLDGEWFSEEFSEKESNIMRKKGHYGVLWSI